MSRPLPLCAWCGEPLSYRARVLIRFDGLPGKPEIGWHIDDDFACDDKDPCCLPGTGNASKMLMIVAERTPRRKGKRIISLWRMAEGFDGVSYAWGDGYRESW